jgi:ribose transport system ATP-binding protein
MVSGEVKLRSSKLPASTSGRLKAGFGMLSEDRKNEGLAQDLSLIDNISISRLQPYSRFGWLQLGKRDQRAKELIREMEIKARDGNQAVSELSGGNQQKVAIARILHQDSKILLMDEPTKGIDVGTKAEIYRMMGRLAAEGRTIVFVSSYLPELLAVCDRIGVMARGKLREVRDTDAWTDDAILECAIAAD